MGCRCYTGTLVPQTTQDLDGALSGPEYSDDSDAAYMKKGEQLCYGYAATVLTDADRLIEHASVHQPMPVSRRGLWQRWLSMWIVYDKGADSKANRAACAKLGIKEGIMRKKPKGRTYRAWDRIRISQKFRKPAIFTTSRQLMQGLIREKTHSLGIDFFVFMGDFSSFFMLPIVGASTSMSATEISSCLAISVILESVVLLLATGQLEKCS